jgi:hypothetical protein
MTLPLLDLHRHIVTSSRLKPAVHTPPPPKPVSVGKVGDAIEKLRAACTRNERSEECLAAWERVEELTNKLSLEITEHLEKQHLALEEYRGVSL